MLIKNLNQHLPSSIFHLPSTIYYLLSTIYHLPSTNYNLYPGLVIFGKQEQHNISFLNTLSKRKSLKGLYASIETSKQNGVHFLTFKISFINCTNIIQSQNLHTVSLREWKNKNCLRLLKIRFYYIKYIYNYRYVHVIISFSLQT